MKARNAGGAVTDNDTRDQSLTLAKHPLLPEVDPGRMRPLRRVFQVGQVQVGYWGSWAWRSRWASEKICGKVVGEDGLGAASSFTKNVQKLNLLSW